jgi:hypothetical protein
MVPCGFDPKEAKVKDKENGKTDESRMTEFEEICLKSDEIIFSLGVSKC